MNALYDLNQKKSVILINGKDAESFLQGQVTCDVSIIKNAEGNLGALCNPKGRVICIFHLFKHDDNYLMVLDNGLCKPIIDRLKMFKFRADVEINDESSQFTVLGDTNLADHNQDNAYKPYAKVRYGSETDLGLILVTNSEFKQASGNNTLSINNDVIEWDRALTSACLPEITPATSELFIPQMLNLEILGGISYQKGCYTGQEIVARLHYKGTVKRRLFTFESNQQIPIGTEIFTAEDKSNIGTIISSIDNVNAGYSGTLVIKTAYSEQSTINCDKFGDISITPPPYSLEV